MEKEDPCNLCGGIGWVSKWAYDRDTHQHIEIEEVRCFCNLGRKEQDPSDELKDNQI